jgi:cell wall-associated NlpC family hydrolase
MTPPHFTELPTMPLESSGQPRAVTTEPGAGNACGEAEACGDRPLQPELKEFIRQHATEAMPNEACGLILEVDGDQVPVRCKNSSSFPQKNFRIHPRDFDAAKRQGKILACYHSHVYQTARPTLPDMTASESTQLPFIILGWPTDVWGFYAPCGWRARLEGRPFCHGVLDCYTLVRDYYHERLQIELPDFYRDDLWWQRGEELFLDNFEKAGFVEVGDLQPHDGLLMQLPRHKVVSHAAVYVGDSHMMHHIPERLSGTTVYTANAGYWARSTRKIVRHREMIRRRSEVCKA